MNYILITKNDIEIDFNGKCNWVSQKFPGCMMFKNVDGYIETILAVVPISEISLILNSETYNSIMARNAGAFDIEK